jgi:hypothetical protein
MSETNYGRVTFPDVAMKFVQDGPVYAMMVVVGVAFFRGNASATEMVLTGAMGLLARMWPKPVTIGGNGSASASSSPHDGGVS